MIDFDFDLSYTDSTDLSPKKPVSPCFLQFLRLYPLLKIFDCSPSLSVTQMDQDKFCDLGSLTEMDTSSIDLSQAPTSGEAYLRQVIVGRSKCEPIVVADRNFSHYAAKRTSQIPIEFLQHAAPSPSAPPPKPWRQKQVFDFDRLRSEFSNRRSEIVKSLPSKIRFPSLNDETGWKRFCFETRSPHYKSSDTADHPRNQEFLKCHVGTPPLLPIVASMSSAQASDLFEFQVAWFAEDGPRPDRMHWLYSLMLLIEKPLTPDVCSALRDLARAISKIRRSISKDDEQLSRSCDLFLCLIVDYFGQSDLADW